MIFSVHISFDVTPTFIHTRNIECLLHYYCSRHCVPVKMNLNLHYVGRSNTNGLCLLGIHSAAPQMSYFVENKEGKYGIKWLTPCLGCCPPFLFLVYLCQKRLFTGELFCARQSSSHWRWSCGQDLAFALKDNTVQPWLQQLTLTYQFALLVF